jgi:hypothetical protein
VRIVNSRVTSFALECGVFLANPRWSA